MRKFKERERREKRGGMENKQGRKIERRREKWRDKREKEVEEEEIKIWRERER